jgi:hypothetical protein
MFRPRLWRDGKCALGTISDNVGKGVWVAYVWVKRATFEI